MKVLIEVKVEENFNLTMMNDDYVKYDEWNLNER